MSKHATANMGQHCGEVFSTMVNHSALPFCAGSPKSQLERDARCCQ